MPRAEMFKLPLPTLTLPSVKAPALVRVTFALPLLERATAPLKALFCDKLMPKLPELKVAVPGTVSTPLCVMMPPAVTVKLPPLVSERVGKVIPLLV